MKQESEVYSEVTEQYELAKRYLDTIHQRMNQQEELYWTNLVPVAVLLATLLLPSIPMV